MCNKLPLITSIAVALVSSLAIYSETGNAQPEPPRLTLDVEAKDEIPEHNIHVVKVSTNAKHTRVRVRKDLFNTLPVLRLESDSDGVKSYGWTGAPGEYLVEVDIFDAELGIGGELKRVTVTGKTPPKPDPPKPPENGPQTPLQAKVAEWLSTVPQAARGDLDAISEVLAGVAAAQQRGELKTIAEMQTALSAGLPQAIKPENREGWQNFGGSLMAEVNQSANADEFADKLGKVAEYMRSVI